MFAEVLGEAAQTVFAFRAECHMLTDPQYLRNRIRNYLVYSEQLFGGEADTAESLAGRPAACALPAEDFDAALAAKLGGAAEAPEADARQLMSSARKSLSFLMRPDDISAIAEAAGAAEYNSEAEDALAPGAEYDMTEHSSNESSNNLTYEYCYRNARGQPLEGESAVSASFTRFLEEEQRLLERAGRATPALAAEPRFLYCNGKRVPAWAADLEALAKVVAEQKATGRVFVEAFGEPRAVENLNLECIFGPAGEGHSRRGESAMWNTPESQDCSRARVKLDALADL